MPAKIAGTADATAVNSDPKGQEQTPTETFQDALLREAKEDGLIIGEPNVTESPPVETEVIEQQPGDEKPPGEETPPGEEEQSAGEEETPPEETDPEKKSIEDQISEFQARGEEPPWYLKRIAEESQKRRTRTSELEKSVELNRKLDAENQRLQGQVQQAQIAATIPRPNRADPLSDIFDESGLQRMTSYYKEIIKLAELNPEGAYEIPFKQPDGSEKKIDLSREQLVDMKLDSEEMLRSGIPRRRAYLGARINADIEARKLYPQLSDPESGWVQMGQQLLSSVPEIQRDPECWKWIARAIKGYQLEVESAKKQKETPVQQIVQNRQRPVAPITPKSRGATPRTAGSDLEKAKKELATKGNSDSAEKYLKTLWARKGGQSKTALVR